MNASEMTTAQAVRSMLLLMPRLVGRAKRLLTSFDAQPGDSLIAAIDLRGRYREPFSNWEAATDAPRRASRAPA